MDFLKRKKQTADKLLKIDIRVLKKEGFLKRGKTISGTLVKTNLSGSKNSVDVSVSLFGEGNRIIGVKYKKSYYDGEQRGFRYKINITTTRCNYGGVRYWFQCPLEKDGKLCGRRIAILYQGGDYFGCRQCYNLCYESNFDRHKITSDQEMDRLWEDIGPVYYKGKITRKYKSYIG